MISHDVGSVCLAQRFSLAVLSSLSIFELSGIFRLFTTLAEIAFSAIFYLVVPYLLLPSHSYTLYSVLKVHCPLGLRSVDLLVGSSGVEPPTSRLSGARSNHLSYEPSLPSARGGDEQARTVDPLRAKQVLSQLSYTPVCAKGLCSTFCSYEFRYLVN